LSERGKFERIDLGRKEREAYVERRESKESSAEKSALAEKGEGAPA